MNPAAGVPEFRGAAVPSAPRCAATAWARSGLMALSGPPQGAPTVPDFDAMAGIEALLRGCEEAAARLGRKLKLDPRLLTERAALLGLRRGGQRSCNGSCRLVETRDGWIAVNLPRATDLESVPALVGCAEGEDPWAAIEDRAHSMLTADLVAMGRLLDLAVAAVPPRRGDEAPVPPVQDVVPVHRIGKGDAARIRDWNHAPPLVIDLSALWAGPLCGQLLRTAGARVIKIESAARPDSVRHASPALYERLNAGKESVVLDFRSGEGRERLRSLIAGADIVISSARPRAFEQLGLEPGTLIERHPGLSWVAITAHGWYGAARNAVGFGDDAAVAGGLLTRSGDGRPMFAGDALADPLAGVAAAAGAFTALAQGGGALVDAALSCTAASVAGARRLDLAERGQVVRHEGAWCLHVAGRCERVIAPHARSLAHGAPAADANAVSAPD